MSRKNTGTSRYVPEETLKDRLDRANAVIQTVEDRRVELKLSKAELARRAAILPQSLRFMLISEEPNPTLHTLIALADALDLEIIARPTRGKPLKRQLGESELQHLRLYNRLHDK